MCDCHGDSASCDPVEVLITCDDSYLFLFLNSAENQLSNMNLVVFAIVIVLGIFCILVNIDHILQSCYFS